MILKSIKNKEIKGVRVLGGIDTLYYFINTSLGELYPNLWDKVKDGEWLYNNFDFIGHSGKINGFVGAWYRRYDTTIKGLPLYKIGFKDYSKQKQILNIQIQLEAVGIYSQGFIELLSIVNKDLSPLLGFDIDSSHCQVSRADLNAFVDGFDFGDISPECFKARTYKSTEILGDGDYYIDDNEFIYKNIRKLETLYLGSKSSPLSLKIYDKRRELDKTPISIPKSIKMAYFANMGLLSDFLWNIEFTLKREVLKQYNIFTISDLLLYAKSVFKDLMDRYSFLGYDTKKYDLYRKNKNQSKLKSHPIWQLIKDSYDANFLLDYDIKRLYKKSKGMTKETFIQYIEKIGKLRHDLDVDISNAEIMKILI